MSKVGQAVLVELRAEIDQVNVCQAERSFRSIGPQTHRLESLQVCQAGHNLGPFLRHPLAVCRDLGPDRFDGVSSRVSERSQALGVLRLSGDKKAASSAKKVRGLGKALWRHTCSGVRATTSSSSRRSIPSSRRRKAWVQAASRQNSDFSAMVPVVKLTSSETDARCRTAHGNAASSSVMSAKASAWSIGTAAGQTSRAVLAD